MGYDSFGLKLGIEGEKQFKDALRDINQSFKVLGSEMKLVSSEFDKNDKSVQAVAARHEALNKAIDAQRDKITTLESALKNASDSFGENDRRTQNWAIQLNNAKAELNGMERELAQSADGADDLGDELKDTGDEAEKSSGKFEKLSGIPISDNHSPSYITVAAICFFVAPTLFNMPNCAVRSSALTRKAFDMTTTDTTVMIRPKTAAKPIIVLIEALS